MRALVFDDHLRFEAYYPDPEPRDDEALIQVHLAGICATDLQITAGYMGFSGVVGHEFVGTVVKGSSSWKGRRVVGEINCVCRVCEMCRSGLANHCLRRTVLGIQGRDGAFADFLTLPVSNLHAVPQNISDEQAVFIEPLAAAFQVIRQCPVEDRMRVAVLGSGRLGILIAQVLKRAGCNLVVIGRNPATLSFCERLHIQTRHVDDLTEMQEYDVVVECTGSPQGAAFALRLVRPRGRIVLKTTCAAETALNLSPVVVNEISVIGSRCGPFSDAIAALDSEQIEVATLISRRFDLSRGTEALQAAAMPGALKILLEVSRQ